MTNLTLTQKIGLGLSTLALAGLMAACGSNSYTATSQPDSKVYVHAYPISNVEELSGNLFDGDLQAYDSQSLVTKAASTCTPDGYRAIGHFPANHKQANSYQSISGDHCNFGDGSHGILRER